MKRILRFNKEEQLHLETRFSKMQKKMKNLEDFKIDSEDNNMLMICILRMKSLMKKSKVLIWTLNFWIWKNAEVNYIFGSKNLEL